MARAFLPYVVTGIVIAVPPVPTVVIGFLSLYLLVVKMRVLGLPFDSYPRASRVVGLSTAKPDRGFP
jgi:hypothetical protein